MEQMGGLSGLVSSVLPVLVLVPVNQKWGLGPALVAAVAVAVLVFIWRLLRKETVMPAVSGLMGVGICAFIAWWMGDAKGYFAYGIWYSLGAGIVFVISALVKWPLVGVIWRGVNGSGHEWRSIRTARLAFMWATLAWAVVFFSRFVVQQWLYGQDDVAWLGVARIAMGLPLTAVVVLATVWAVRVADKAERESRALTGDDSEDSDNQETV
ncbi:MAG TPA: DUF3159 domain-containing protein [Candidatus Corynebacterium avicola]|uniref:DUF3159 domain-containing protein n=1 Tax=Candidatus Corynebacterium avicola TaxID=2838527 RepID=A0A9D1ULR8_9CORY|nr:DUF3159 domain-containing protein [Candidatus Corynebacterium avicola]